MKEITTIKDLIDILKSDNIDYEGDIWFRGHANINWKLLPGQLRIAGGKSESSLLSRFKQSAAMLLDRHPKDDFDWMFLMQHYGAPTRLLDWTESALTALYFATSDATQENEDGVLWQLKPTELNKLAGIDVDGEKDFILCFDDDELINYTISSLRSNPRTKLTPLATIATRNNTRIQAQLGVFTIHHLDHRPIEEFCTLNETVAYKVPKKYKTVIRNELSLLGITKFTLFPELSSIGEMLKSKQI